jgi:hypothetical protein
MAILTWRVSFLRIPRRRRTGQNVEDGVSDKDVVIAHPLGASRGWAATDPSRPAAHAAICAITKIVSQAAGGRRPGRTAP